MSIGWIVVSFFTLFVGMGMAEITYVIPLVTIELVSRLLRFMTTCTRSCNCDT